MHNRQRGRTEWHSSTTRTTPTRRSSAPARWPIIGYGSQGHAHALNLAESGVDVRVGLREGSASTAEGEAAGLRVVSVAQASAEADLVMILLPDTEQASVYDAEIAPHLAEGDALFFAHGFNIRFGQIIPPPGVDVGMVAPKGPGHLVRRTYTEGGGVPSLIAVARTPSGKAMALALSYAHALGATRAGVLDTTFEEETETDLFGEQVVLCGGAHRARQAAFETLVDAGYQPESAYFECLHELKLIVDLMYEQGISGMRFSISDTAEYGDITRGPGSSTTTSGPRCGRSSTTSSTGAFAAEWIAENPNGRPQASRSCAPPGRAHQIEQVGAELRAMMPFISAGSSASRTSPGAEAGAMMESEESSAADRIDVGTARLWPPRLVWPSTTHLTFCSSRDPAAP